MSKLNSPIYKLTHLRNFYPCKLFCISLVIEKLVHQTIELGRVKSIGNTEKM